MTESHFLSVVTEFPCSGQSLGSQLRQKRCLHITVADYSELVQSLTAAEKAVLLEQRKL